MFKTRVDLFIKFFWTVFGFYLVSGKNGSLLFGMFCFDFCNKNNFTFALTFATRKSTLCCIGNFEENIDVSHIQSIEILAGIRMGEVGQPNVAVPLVPKQF